MKHTITGWIGMSIPEPGEASYAAFMSYKPRGEYYAPVREHSIEVDVPDDFDYRPAAVEAIDAQIAEKRAEMTAAITELLGKRAQLLALENAA